MPIYKSEVRKPLGFNAGGMKMTILPFQINEVMHLYNRVSKLSPSTILDREKDEPQDIVNISPEAKKKQIIQQAKSEVLERVRDTR
jgi:hypothetical protein